MRDGKKLTHEGIKVEFVGSIGAFGFWDSLMGGRCGKPVLIFDRAVLRSGTPPRVFVAVAGAGGAW